MKALILTHFDMLRGPKIFFQVPKLLKEEDLDVFKNLLDIKEHGFFAHIFGNFKSANLIFKIPSEFARGNEETLLISIVIDINSEINLHLSQDLLEGFAEELNTIQDVYKGFYLNSSRHKGDPNKYFQIKNLLHIFNKGIDSALKTLEIAEIRYQTLFEAARDPILIIERKSMIIIDANKQAVKIFEPHQEVIIGLDSKSIQFDGEYKHLEELIQNYSQVEKAFPIIVHFKNSYGKITCLEISGNKFKIGDQSLIQFVFHDLTEKLNYEQKLNKSEKKYREAYGNAELYKNVLTHDINSILQTILSNIEHCKLCIDRDGEIDKLNEKFDAIRDQVKKGVNLIKNI